MDLSDARIRKLAKTGRYADGDGLYLQVTQRRDGGLARSWFVRLRLPEGRQRDMGLGAYPIVPLAEARRKALEARQEAKAGRDPLAARQAKRAEARLAPTRAVSFRQAADGYIAAHAHLWRSAKHTMQWQSSLAAYAYPVFGALPVAAVNRPLVIEALDSIWTVKPETASRVRQRIETVLDWAAARGLREGDNPARWKGGLEHALPKRDKRRQGRHAALPFDDAPAFWRELQNRDGAAARALAFAILTAARTGEVIGADWREIDLANAVWTVPAGRMKAGREHRVPLSNPARALLHSLNPEAEGRVFALSNMAMLALLRRMGRTDITAHGFRSTFRDWAAERTEFPSDVAEAALAHAVGNKTEAAYWRGDLFEKRRQLMEAWGAYCATPATERGAVVA